MLHSPAVGGALCRSSVRRSATARCCSARLREIAILAVAAHWSSDFEQYAHEPLGRAGGADRGADRRLLAAGAEVALDDPAEAPACASCGHCCARATSPTRSTRRARVLGEQALVELTALVGYYATLALQLRVFRVGVRPDLNRQVGCRTS